MWLCHAPDPGDLFLFQPLQKTVTALCIHTTSNLNKTKKRCRLTLETFISSVIRQHFSVNQNHRPVGSVLPTERWFIFIHILGKGKSSGNSLGIEVLPDFLKGVSFKTSTSYNINVRSFCPFSNIFLKFLK